LIALTLSSNLQLFYIFVKFNESYLAIKIYLQIIDKNILFEGEVYRYFVKKDTKIISSLRNLSWACRRDCCQSQVDGWQATV